MASGAAFELSPFTLEWFAANRPQNQLPLSAVCNCHCLFCSNDLNPFPIERGIVRDIDDLKLQLAAMTANDGPIRLSDALPGRISEGEALLHPRLFEILDLVRRKFFYNPLCFTTNGSMLDEAFLARLAAYRPIEITLSMHSTIPESWSRIFGKRGDPPAAATAIAAPPLLKRLGMDLIGTIVPLPAVCG
jgi:MoaA/NifB/PqqE/SkfB family radical SAM enzyme